MMRQGLRELRAALYPDSNVAQPADYGILGNATPSEAAESRRAQYADLEFDRWVNDGGSAVDSRLQQADAARDSRERESKDLEPEK